MMQNIFKSFTLLLLGLLWERSESFETKLRKSLLQDYDPAGLPSVPTHVSVLFTVLQYVMNEDMESIDLNLWIAMKWIDPRLKWNSTEEQIKQLAIPQHLIWKPDITLYNSADNPNINPYGEINAVVMSDGEVLWVPPAHVKTMCLMDMTFWPHDVHNCTANFGSWVHSAATINVTLDSTKLNFENTLEGLKDGRLQRRGEWEVFGSDAVRTITKYSCCPDEYVKLQLNIAVMRNSPAFRWLVQIPCAVLSFLTAAIFLLPPNAVGKITFGGIVLMMDLFFLLGASQFIGHSPSHTPIIVKFIATQLIITCISVVISALIFRMTMNPTAQTAQLPNLLLRILKILATYMCIQTYPTWTNEAAVSFSRDQVDEGVQLTDDLKTVNFQCNKDWLLLVAVLDRTCLVIFSFICIVNLLNYSQVL